jgi:hypothetical protein
VAQRGRFSVYVFPEEGQPHSRPHCHIYWVDGAASVDLLNFAVLAGDPVPAEGRELLEINAARIKRA